MAIVSMTVNGKQVSAEAEDRTLLVYFLREQLRLTGTHIGCDTSQCGACTVLVDGRAVRSCVTPISAIGTSEITTIEGLGSLEKPHALQRAFIEEQAAQCGYCIPGMLMAGAKLLAEHAHPDLEQVRTALSGNICRCTGYRKILDAVIKTGSRV